MSENIVYYKELMNGMFIEQRFNGGCREFENAYFINYYLKCSMWAIDKLLEYAEADLDAINITKIHFLSDILLFYIGQISDRFCINKKNTELNEIRKQNKSRYNFNNRYKILSSRDARNAMTHIFEKDYSAIKTNKNISLFNVISDKVDSKLIDKYDKNIEYFAYIVDFRSKVIIIRNQEEDKIKIDIFELKNELNNLCNELEKM